jgi:hypothetical protein
MKTTGLKAYELSNNKYIKGFVSVWQQCVGTSDACYFDTELLTNKLGNVRIT